MADYGAICGNPIINNLLFGYRRIYTLKCGFQCAVGRESREAEMSKAKKVGHQDLKRLVKERKILPKDSAQKIDSPLARYNNIGQLSCMLCNAPVKSHLLWNAHIQGRTHKQNVARLKEEKEKKEIAYVPEPPKLKRQRLEESTGPGVKPVAGAGGLAGLGGYSESDSDGEDNRSAPQTNNTSQSALPADFFDNATPSSSSAPSDIPDKEEPPPPLVISEKLPEGFFDDPKMDAKVRKVEYRDKMEDEWELFQRAVKQEHVVSEAILEEDNEEANEERNLVEVEEQLKKWSKINDLAKKKETLVIGKESGDQSQSDSEQLEEQEFEEFLDWRSKNAWK